MPLPDGATLSLQGHSRLGDTVQSKPKQAMIVRMSAETLEALESSTNSPRMEFEFGENTGIHIGETFFAMRSQKETSPHEIYLRSASAAKPMAPLKLYANVTGKFIVERELVGKVAQEVRKQTQVAQEKRSERQTILLDAPPVAVNGKATKRKQPGSSTIVKKAIHGDTLRVHSTPSSGPPARKVSPLPQIPPSKVQDAAARKRLIHCLALTPRLGDEVIKLVGGPRADLVELLKDVAEQTLAARGDKNPQPWELKTSSWLEVRPYEWPRLSENERTNMARQARRALTTLRIPESDPAWEHVRYRNMASSYLPPPPPQNVSNSSASSSSTTTKIEPKRPAVSKDPKLKAKGEAAKGKREIWMKDESAKAPRVNAIRREEGDRSASPTPSNSSKSAARRAPGSGFKVNKTSPQSSVGPPDIPPKKSTGPTDARSSSQRPPPQPSLPAKPVPPIAPPAAGQERKSTSSAAPKVTKRPREPVEESDREQHRERERDRIPKERPLPAGTKRKIVTQDSPDDATSKASSAKRQKIDDQPLPAPTPPSSHNRGRDLSLPKKPTHDVSPAPRPKIKKEFSPAPIPRMSASSSSQSQDKPGSPLSRTPIKGDRSKTNGASLAKGKRDAPVYTSSEDEGEIPQPRKRDNPSTTTPSANNGRHPSGQRPRASLPTSKDSSSLRARYNATYAEYLGKFTQIVAEKRKLEALLNGDSEGELDVMSPEELAKLSAEYHARKEELENIQEMFKKRKSGSASD
ncbi:hypothetical protein BJ138DRAFT_1151642 [Hygrophoropsis aurantiaca]|uniref:Uncharacterized protein n=1 Tax=Hygrophoropsis aurantiaca TaxID=72124 RepID=A0ACB8AD77_9AGAM|nr:hypothetical protein BJ138DRAFT_1151642 [Hygrophoropsis aurantiaca]